MIAQGSDGLSCGNLAEGVMCALQMKDFVPTNQDTFKQSPKLRNWLNEWTNQEWTFLDAPGWFTTGQELCDDLWEINPEGMMILSTEPGTFVWLPPPVVAGIAMEELRCSRHKFNYSTHLNVILHFFLTEWRKQ